MRGVSNLILNGQLVGYRLKTHTGLVDLTVESANNVGHPTTQVPTQDEVLGYSKRLSTGVYDTSSVPLMRNIQLIDIDGHLTTQYEIDTNWNIRDISENEEHIIKYYFNEAEQGKFV